MIKREVLSVRADRARCCRRCGVWVSWRLAEIYLLDCCGGADGNGVWVSWRLAEIYLLDRCGGADGDGDFLTNYLEIVKDEHLRKVRAYLLREGWREAVRELQAKGRGCAPNPRGWEGREEGILAEMVGEALWRGQGLIGRPIADRPSPLSHLH
jgi:hypothetical protein